MITIRNDDVLLSSAAKHVNSFERFRLVHNIICQSTELIHVPTILTEEIQEFPEAIEFIKEETKKGRMQPELHGLRHIDYGSLSKQEVIEHLAQAYDWFIRTFGYRPLKWYTPWGASQEHLHEAVKPLKLQLVDCSRVVKLKGRYGVTQLLTDGKPASYFHGQEIIMHWWNAIDIERLNILVKALNETCSNY